MFSIESLILVGHIVKNWCRVLGIQNLTSELGLAHVTWPHISLVRTHHLLSGWVASFYQQIWTMEEDPGSCRSVYCFCLIIVSTEGCQWKILVNGERLFELSHGHLTALNESQWKSEISLLEIICNGINHTIAHVFWLIWVIWPSSWPSLLKAYPPPRDAKGEASLLW